MNRSQGHFAATLAASGLVLLLGACAPASDSAGGS